MKPFMKILVLAGTSNARQLCQQLNEIQGLHIIASLRDDPYYSEYPVQLRTGGFGGIEGIVSYIRMNAIDILIDATHPFASQIKLNAIQAANKLGIELLVLKRPLWQPTPECQWISTSTLLGACELIPKGSRVLAAIGHKNLFHHFPTITSRLATSKVFLRTMSPIFDHLPSHWEAIQYRPPISVNSELKLFDQYRISCLLCRNSGGVSGHHKLTAASQLGLQIFMVNPPKINYGHETNIKCFNSVEEIMNERFKSG